ncbi:MAG: hypothetical protein Q7T25_12335, partial [Sideroxyarcus sp.]|nr:hypothetical protein [Sideroxyarcus sp.]
MSILHVALDLPLPRLFDYSCDDATAADIGMRVLVPFGNKQTVGVIVSIADSSEIGSGKLKSAVRILRETPALAHDWLELVQFCSDYYHRPLGEVIFAGLPVRLRKPGATLTLKQEFAYRINAVGREVMAQLPPRSKVKHALLLALSESDRAETALLAQSKSAGRALADLLGAGWIERYVFEPAAGAVRFVDRPALNAEQQLVLEQIGLAGAGYAAYLL